jgi:hypothetical protein
MINPATVIAAVGAITGLAGIVYGATGKTDRRRRIGLWLCQGGMSVAGLVLIAAGIFSSDASNAAFGLLLLVFGTGITAIGRGSGDRTRHG